MANTVTVRIPVKLREEADALVQKGYYKNLSDLILSCLRIEVHKKVDAVKMIRDLRDKETKKYIKKAGGDPKKGFDLFFNDLMKFQEEEIKKNPEFWKD